MIVILSKVNLFLLVILEIFFFPAGVYEVVSPYGLLTHTCLKKKKKKFCFQFSKALVSSPSNL